MSNDLLFSIGLDVSDLKTSAVAAKEQADEIKKGFAGFKDVLGAGGVAAAVFSFFRGVVDYAMEAKAPIDSNVAAVARFGSSIASMKTGVMESGAAVLGFFNKAGEGWGLLTRSLIEGTQNAWEAMKNLDFKGMLDGYKKGYEDVKAAHLGEIEVQKREAEVMELKKTKGEELKRLGEQLAAIDKQRNDLLDQGLTKQETVNNLVDRVRVARAAEAATMDDVVAKQSAKVATQQAELNLLKALNELDRENLELQKKAEADEAKSLDARIKAFNTLGEVKAKELDFERQKLSLDEQQKLLTAQIIALEKELTIAGISESQEAVVRQALLGKRKDLEEVITKSVSLRLTKEQEISSIIATADLAKLIAARGELAAQAAEQYKNEGHVDEALQAQIDKIDQAIAKKKEFYAIGRLNAGSKDQDLTDRELEAKIANLRSQKSELDAQAYGRNDNFSKGMLNIVAPQLANAEFEQNLRRQFRNDYASMGEAAVLKRDPFQEERYRQYIRPDDEKRAAEQARNIGDILERLKKVFPV